MEFDRHRRLRVSPTMRTLVRETHLRKEDLIYPIFVVEKDDVKKEIASLPNVYQISLNLLHEEIKEAYDLGIRSFIFFGIPNEKMSAEQVHLSIMVSFNKRRVLLKSYMTIFLLSQILVYVSIQIMAIVV